MTLRYVDWFCGAGGSTQGAAVVPGVQPILAANHDKVAIGSHSANFPDVEHFRGDIKDVDVTRHPYGELYWASPECTNWTVAKGKRADYADHAGLFDEPEPAGDVQRSRALMEDVVRYLRGMHLRHQPVLAGVVENVVDVHKWTDWDRWVGEIRALGYRTRLIALNSAHAAPVRTPRAPQSRDRLYLAYWHESIGRDPDWDKWLRPACWCAGCEEIVDGVQTWKRPGQDMGRYGSQYYYRCPKTSCRGAKVEPFYSPASTAIDWSLPGQRIGDRERPLSDKTMARIEAALKKWGPSIIEAAGHTFERRPGVRSWPLTEPLRTLHTTQTKALVMDAVHGAPTISTTDELLRTQTTAYTRSLLVPVEGREGKQATSVLGPLRTQTTRNDLALLTMLRGQNAAKPVGQPMDTVAASGNHHGLLVPYYSASTSGTPTSHLMGTLTTNDRYALVEPPTIDPMDCLFRMLEPHEIGAGMAFLPDYIVLGTKRQRVKQYGNAVTPPVSEVLTSALVECIQGHDIDWSAA